LPYYYLNDVFYNSDCEITQFNTSEVLNM